MRTNNKQVRRDEVNTHILDIMSLGELKANLEAVKDNRYQETLYQCAIKLVEDGSFLIYNDDIKDFLNGLGINPEHKEYSNEKSWKLYCHLMASEIEKLVRSK